jgi:hypothetical protein
MYLSNGIITLLSFKEYIYYNKVMYHFLTLGHDCSPAAALRNLDLREQALPFDWVVSNVTSIHKCVEENFSRFHINLSYIALKPSHVIYHNYENSYSMRRKWYTNARLFFSKTT